MKIWWTASLIAPISAFVSPSSLVKSTSLLFTDNGFNNGVQSNANVPLPVMPTNGLSQPSPPMPPEDNKIPDIPQNNPFAQPATNGATVEAARKTYEREDNIDNSSSQSMGGTIVNSQNGYVTMDRGQTQTNEEPAAKVPIASKISNKLFGNNGFASYGDAANGYAANSVEETIEDMEQEEPEEDYDDTGDVAMSAFEGAFEQMQALLRENKSLKQELRVMQASEEELLYEQERLEREVELLQDEMVHLQNDYRTLMQNKEQVDGQLYLLMLEREATQVQYRENLSVDTRMEQAELRLQQRGVYAVEPQE